MAADHWRDPCDPRVAAIPAFRRSRVPVIP